MVHCICIKWDGKDYNAEYVNRLYRGIKRNTSVDFAFTCFSDHGSGLESGIEHKPIPHFTGNWFSKISLYNKELYNPEDQIFFFDLDTVIIRNIDDILSYRGNFILLRDFYRVTGYGSGLMSWRPEAVHHMWTAFTPESRCNHGDQGWPEIHYPNADLWQEKYPEKIVSYKVHISKKMQPIRNIPFPQGNLDTASIVCFHGQPRPHHIHDLNWMKEHWI